METLPLPLLRSILSFAVPGYGEDVGPKRCAEVTTALKALKLVSKTWVLPISEIAQQFEQATVALTLKEASGQEELQQMYHRLAERGNRVTKLFLSMERNGVNTKNRQVGLTPQDMMKQIDIDWLQIFKSLSLLTVLNLDEMPFDGLHLIPILEAASMHCLKLRSLTLPYADKAEDDQHIEPVTTTLYQALRRWRVDGNLGGLRGLKAPIRNIDDPFRSAAELIDNVVTNCPQVEILNDYKEFVLDSYCLSCDEAWPLTLLDWEKFNETCKNLREFNWVLVPFGDPYFRTFGEYTKPQLKQLTLGVGLSWDWRWYFYDKSDAAGEIPHADWEKREYCERPGYGYLATDVSPALKGCPLLDDLQIQLYRPLHPDADIDMGSYVSLDDFQEHKMLNANVFGDNFCEQLSVLCPLISSFAIIEHGERYNSSNMVPIKTFTDRGLMALTRLTLLRYLELHGVSCTGTGVFEFLNSLSDEFAGNRTFFISVGGSDSKRTFYEEVMDLLLRIAEVSELPCARRKFVLLLGNCSFNSSNAVESKWSETYLHELEHMMNRVKAAHPSLRQHATVINRRGDTFKRISEFGLYSVHADPSIYNRLMNWEGEEQNDGFKIVNGVDQGEEVQDDDDMDEDSDMGGYEYYEPYDDYNSDMHDSDSSDDYGGYACPCCY